MSIVKYRPQSTFVAPFGDLVQEFLGRDIGQFFGSDDMKSTAPSVNILEREGNFELQMLAPGYTKQDLKLSMENDILTISAQREKESLNENERFTRREFAHRSFSRSFRMPESVDTESITAEFKDGVLHVSIPKAEKAKPKTRAISVN